MIDAASPVPLWQQVVNLIRHRIEQGEWPPHCRIPSERELCEQYRISRTTVRQALAEAVNAGLLERIHGKGTFVAPAKIRQPLLRITSFEQTLEGRGLIPQVQLLEMRTRLADAASAHLIGVPAGSELVFFRLLGLGSGEPMAVYDSLVPAGLGAALQGEVHRRRETGRAFLINQLIMDMRGYPFLQAEQTFEAVPVEPGLAPLLGLPRRAPVFSVTTLFSSPSGQPVEFRRAVYRGDKYQFHVTRLYDRDHGR